MPVIATPITSSDACAHITVRTPEVTKIYDRPNPTKIQAIEVSQGQVITIQWTMKDVRGDPVDLDGCAASVKLRIFEATLTSGASGATEIQGAIIDAPLGIVEAELPFSVVEFPGISLAEFAVFDLNGVLKFTNTIYLVVNVGLFTGTISRAGPPTIAEIRLHMRDSAPEDNYLLDEVEFDLAEIAACIKRPVEQFNAMPPPIDQHYTTANFPFRYYWLDAIIGNLLLIGAHHYRRNHLSYSAGGISIDDKNKEQSYMQTAMMYKKQWEEWAKTQKVNMNMEAGFGELVSAYSHYHYYFAG